MPLQVYCGNAARVCASLGHWHMGVPLLQSRNVRIQPQSGRAVRILIRAIAHGSMQVKASIALIAVVLAAHTFSSVWHCTLSQLPCVVGADAPMANSR